MVFQSSCFMDTLELRNYMSTYGRRMSPAEKGSNLTQIADILASSTDLVDIYRRGLIVGASKLEVPSDFPDLITLDFLLVGLSDVVLINLADTRNQKLKEEAQNGIFHTAYSLRERLLTYSKFYRWSVVHNPETNETDVIEIPH